MSAEAMQGKNDDRQERQQLAAGGKAQQPYGSVGDKSKRS